MDRDNPGIGAWIVDGSLSGRQGSRTEAKAEVIQRLPKPLARALEVCEIAAACAGDGA